MRTRSSIALAAAIAAALAAPAAVAADGYGAEVHAGTLGAGVGGAFGVSESINVRLGVNGYSHDSGFEEGDIDYAAQLDLSSAYAVADWHPFAGTAFFEGLRMSGGLYYNANEAAAVATVEGGDQVGGYTVPPGMGGSMTGEITTRDAAPYLGIGWGDAVDGAWPVAFSLDVGVLSQGEPSVNLENRDIQGLSDSDVEREERELENDLADYDLYPVVQAGLVVRF